LLEFDHKLRAVRGQVHIQQGGAGLESSHLTERDQPGTRCILVVVGDKVGLRRLPVEAEAAQGVFRPVAHAVIVPVLAVGQAQARDVGRIETGGGIIRENHQGGVA